jgi:hypothetical protein
MRIILLPAIAGLALAGVGPLAFAGDNDRPPGTGTTRPGQDNALPMDRHGVIRPAEPNTRDPNQAEVPGTRDNPNIRDRDRRFDPAPRPPAQEDMDRDDEPMIH